MKKSLTRKISRLAIAGTMLVAFSAVAQQQPVMPALNLPQAAPPPAPVAAPPPVSNNINSAPQAGLLPSTQPAGTATIVPPASPPLSVAPPVPPTLSAAPPQDQAMPPSPPIPMQISLPKDGADNASSAESDDPPGSQVANQAMQKLKDAGTEINLADVANAQDALARLDLLLQIEQKLGAVDTAHQQRVKQAMLASGVPNALPIPAPNAPQMMQNGLGGGNFSNAGGGDYSVDRVYGSNGKYTALVNDGPSHILVHVGDTLPDGSKISTMTINGVQVSTESGTYRTLPFSQASTGSGMQPRLAGSGLRP